MGRQRSQVFSLSGALDSERHHVPPFVPSEPVTEQYSNC
jgi:hypothetical protein